MYKGVSEEVGSGGEGRKYIFPESGVFELIGNQMMMERVYLLVKYIIELMGKKISKMGGFWGFTIFSAVLEFF
jgi:hypothetical protein